MKCSERDTSASTGGKANTGSSFFARYHLTAGLNRVRFHHFNGYRHFYLVLKDAIGQVEVRRVTSHHCRADLDFRDRFLCNDRAAESLYRISRRSLKLNTQAYPFDCNTREQGTYWGDGLWVTESIGHLTGDFSHLRHLCYAASEEVAASGPFIHSSLYGAGMPLFDYCLVPPECLWRYYRFTGDLAAVQENIATMRTIVSAFGALKSEAGLVVLGGADVPDNGLLFLDHPGNGWHPMTTVGNDRREPNAGLNLFYLQALQAMVGLESALGENCGTLHTEIADLKKTLRTTFWNAQHGMLADAAGPDITQHRFSQITTALAITVGVMEGTEARTALGTALDIPRHPCVSQGTPYSYFFLAEAAAVSRLGHEAVPAFTRAFSRMLQRGATTTWEAWHAENHDSLNHAWSAPFPHLIRRAIIGLSPEVPGYTRLRLQPDLSAFREFAA